VNGIRRGEKPARSFLIHTIERLPEGGIGPAGIESDGLGVVAARLRHHALRLADLSQKKQRVRILIMVLFSSALQVAGGGVELAPL